VFFLFLFLFLFLQIVPKEDWIKLPLLIAGETPLVSTKADIMV